MSWSFPSLEPETITFTDDENVIAYFTEGQCPALAYELHKLKGWTIAMISDHPAGSPWYCGHVFIIDSDGMAIDIKGRRSLEEVKNEWYFCSHIYRFENLKRFEYEMIEWELAVRFNRDSEAKKWAKLIADMLDD